MRRTTRSAAITAPQALRAGAARRASSPATLTTLVAPRGPAQHAHGGGSDAERRAQEAREGLVGRALDRRRVQPHHERALALPAERVLATPAAARARAA